MNNKFLYAQDLVKTNNPLALAGFNLRISGGNYSDTFKEAIENYRKEVIEK